ncbi:uncharacterized protein LOC34621494 [Cyclospora cayetanensis]|uniref:Uncharacterized protein LOC34621494 n=1 Tax=Cyclospora cayetanensis TaxID=88456 RepID=A0A6P6RWF4_9EIME|nr:uncharacterized protein LOC34621494 [Cyclospora cayetanensis]
MNHKLAAATGLPGQLPLRESFRDFDSLRRGVCSRAQAESVFISALKIQLDESDWRSLFQQFLRPDGMFAYDSLCRHIESKLGNPVCVHSSTQTHFEELEAEHYPVRVVPVPTPSELRIAQEDKASMTPEELVRLTTLKNRLKCQVQQTRKIMLPTFHDFDKRRTQHVTRWQLWRILGMLDLPVTEEELDLLCLWLCDKGNLQEVAYRPLLAVLDPPAKEPLQEETIQEGLKESIYYKNGKIVPLAESMKKNQESIQK